MSQGFYTTVRARVFPAIGRPTYDFKSLSRDRDEAPGGSGGAVSAPAILLARRSARWCDPL